MKESDPICVTAFIKMNFNLPLPQKSWNANVWSVKQQHREMAVKCSEEYQNAPRLHTGKANIDVWKYVIVRRTCKAQS
jgi:hypothetical protein